MIHIFLRETNHNKPNNERPDWFNYEKCFKSLLDSLDEKFCKLTVIFDGTPQNHHVTKYNKSGIGYDIVEINAGNDFASNTKTFEYIKTQNIKENELIAVFENDYLYLDWVRDVLFLYYYNVNYQMWDNTYVSLFDHLDKYIFNVPGQGKDENMYNNLKSQIYLGLTRYWRETPSTCGSFLMGKIVFDKDYDIHTSGNADNTRFGECQKRGRKVLTPMPSLATHGHRFFGAPFVNWKEINDKIKLL